MKIKTKINQLITKHTEKGHMVTRLYSQDLLVEEIIKYLSSRIKGLEKQNVQGAEAGYNTGLREVQRIFG